MAITNFPQTFATAISQRTWASAAPLSVMNAAKQLQFWIALISLRACGVSDPE
jgi:hypothetical protein